jgi:hypothetical protein
MRSNLKFVSVFPVLNTQSMQIRDFILLSLVLAVQINAQIPDENKETLRSDAKIKTDKRSKAAGETCKAEWSKLGEYLTPECKATHRSFPTYQTRNPERDCLGWPVPVQPAEDHHSLLPQIFQVTKPSLILLTSRDVSFMRYRLFRTRGKPGHEFNVCGCSSLKLPSTYS